MHNTMNLTHLYQTIREHSENICKPLQIEDYVVQIVPFASPAKWHLAHTTWFFETFILKNHFDNLTKNEIEVILPSEADMLFIDSVRKEIYANNSSSETLEKYNSIIEKYAKKAAVVIACTELSLAFKNTNELEAYDMSRIQIQKAFEEIH